MRIVAGFEDDVDDFAQGIEQVEEDVEKLLAGNGRGQDRDGEIRIGVPVGVDAVTLRGTTGTPRAGRMASVSQKSP